MFVGGWHRGGDNVAAAVKTQHGKRRPRNELHEKSQIVKERTKRAAKKAYQLHRTEQRRKRKGFKPGSKQGFRRKKWRLGLSRTDSTSLCRSILKTKNAIAYHVLIPKLMFDLNIHCWSELILYSTCTKYMYLLFTFIVPEYLRDVNPYST